MHPSTNIDCLVGRCQMAKDFSELVAIATEELEKFIEGAHIVCGPISTGGRGNPEDNLKVFSTTIQLLKENGYPIFSQMPYEERIFHFRNQWWEENPDKHGEYFMPILEDFYLPLFRTKMIDIAWFIPGWESSFGARWERQQLLNHGARFMDLSEEWVQAIKL